MRSLVSDTSLIYLHLIAPPEQERELTPVSETLGDFEEDSKQVKLTDAQLGKALGTLVGRRPQRFLTLAGSIDADHDRTLYFKHTLIPHVPFEYLRSGRRYWQSTDPIPGLYGEPSWDNAYLRRQAYQRHILQMQFGDFLLGKALQRLRDQGLYERALIVVTSDGGESFLHRGDRNAVTKRNVEDIAATPLLIKAPGRLRGRIVDRHVRTMDVLPTIAELLDAKLPWTVQGRPVWSSSAGVPEQVSVVSKEGKPVSLSFEDFRRRVSASVGRKVRAFGPHGERLFQVDPAPELVGRPLAELDVSRGAASPPSSRAPRPTGTSIAVGIRAGADDRVGRGIGGPRAPVGVRGQRHDRRRRPQLRAERQRRRAVLDPGGRTLVPRREQQGRHPAGRRRRRRSIARAHRRHPLRVVRQQGGGKEPK